MGHEPRKMSDILKEMAERLLRDPQKVPSGAACAVALLFANAAWNECVGLDYGRDRYRDFCEQIEAVNPALWNEFKTTDTNAMIDELVRYKQAHFPHDRRRILVCGIPEGKVHVEWLPAAEPGVDSFWEMHLFGLVRSGNREGAIQFLHDTRGLSRKLAEAAITEINANLGVG